MAGALAHTNHINVSLLGFENDKARPDLTDDSGFWLSVKAEDMSLFLTALNLRQT
jgi:hypothetical protein